MNLKKHEKLLLTGSFLLFVLFPVFSQDVEEKLVPKEFSIPVSPVFDLMGVSPSSVSRASDIKDFKVDWSFKTWRLNPNIAIQGQPIWEIFYNRKDLTKYQQSTPLMRKLASLDLSLGTIVNEDNDRRIGFAGKINLINSKDPLMASELYEEVGLKYKDEREKLISEIASLETQLDTMTDIFEKPGVRSSIDYAINKLNSLNFRRMQEIKGISEVYQSENWNAASLDLAFGRIYTYQTDSSGSLVSLRLNRNTAWGLWLNGSFPLGKNLQLSGLIRSSWYSEELSFILLNENTFEETKHSAVADNKLFSIGTNIRYGSRKFSLFVEYLYETKSTKSALDALKNVFRAIDGFSINEETVKWTVAHPTTFSIGGDWLLNRNVVINFGLKSIIDKTFKTKAIVPVAGISCLMR